MREIGQSGNETPHSISELFFQHFEVKIPNENELIQAYGLRYKVFCKQLGYFDGDEMRIERDEFDTCAHCCIVKDKSTKKVVGFVRLVHANESLKLPFSSFLTEFPINRHDSEISRLVVCPDYRHKLMGINIYALLFNALFLAINLVAEHNRIDESFVFIEKRLARALKTFGTKLTQIAEPVKLEFKNNTSSVRALYNAELIFGERANVNFSAHFVERIREALYPEQYPFYQAKRVVSKAVHSVSSLCF